MQHMVVVKMATKTLYRHLFLLTEKLVIINLILVFDFTNYVYCQPPEHEMLEGAYLDIPRSTPGTHHEFKINVGPGKMECFYQNVKSGANLHIAFEVLRGADRNLDFVMFTPKGEIMAKHLWTNQGVTDMPIKKGGVFAFCMDNTFSRFSSKLVYFFLSTFVQEEWQKYSKELEEFDLSVHNFTAKFADIDNNIRDMKNLQAVGRQHAITDWYIIRANYTYIQNFSMIICFVTILTGCLQTYFVKRLFLSHDNMKKSSGSNMNCGYSSGLKVCA